MRHVPATLLLLLAPFALAAAQGPAPTLTVNGQTATFSAPLVILRGNDSHVSMLFPTTPPAAALEAAARQAASWQPVLASVGPAAVVDLDYTPGSTSGMVEQLRQCRISGHGFRTAFEVKGKAAECHVVSVGGMLKTPGGIAGLIEGKGPGYTMRLPFGLGFTAPPTTMAAASTPAAAPGASAASATPLVPLNTVTGSGTYQGQTVKVTHGLAWWAAEQGQVRVALFDHAPKPGLLAAARTGDFSDDPSIVDVYVMFKDAGRDLAAVDYCYVNVTFPKGGPMGTNTNAKGCGLEAITTTAKPGEPVFMRLKGGAPGPAGRYTWDVTFHLPIAQ
jgi:hypothetical protein